MEVNVIWGWPGLWREVRGNPYLIMDVRGHGSMTQMIALKCLHVSISLSFVVHRNMNLLIHRHLTVPVKIFNLNCSRFVDSLLKINFDIAIRPAHRRELKKLTSGIVCQLDRRVVRRKMFRETEARRRDPFFSPLFHSLSSACSHNVEEMNV